MKRKLIASIIATALVLSLCSCDDMEDFDSYEDYESPTIDSNEVNYDEIYDGNYEEPDYSYEDSYDGYVNSGYYGEYPFDTSIGSAKELDGKIAVISIFVNDNTTGWDFSDSNDQELAQTIYNNLSIATDYLEDVSSNYGHNVEFVFDWNEHPELYYEMSINMDYSNIDNDYTIDYSMWQGIQENISTSEVLEKTGATQTIYMAYYNTPSSNTVTSCARNFYDGMEYPYEICYIFMNCEGYIEPPACFAHEILHTFGAPDLYTVSDYGINQEYVDYVESIGLNDIMRDCSDPQTYEYVYDSINNEVTDITAYYVGLTDYSETVAEWGFEKSQH